MKNTRLLRLSNGSTCKRITSLNGNERVTSQEIQLFFKVHCHVIVSSKQALNGLKLSLKIYCGKFNYALRH